MVAPESTRELVALGFWLRDGQIKKLQATQANTLQGDNSITVNKALGTLVHFCPANVDTMFVYSWICSLLMGNNNIVRLSGQQATPLQQTLLGVLSGLFSQPQFAEIAKRNVICTWSHDDVLTAKVCGLVEGRVIWGGDTSI